MKTTEDPTYIYPKRLAKRMKKIDMRTQLEASMLSMTLLMIGIILVGIHQILYGDQTIVFKIMIVFNLICGFVLIGSQVVTSYQQYVNHMQTMGIDPKTEKIKFRELRKQRKAQKRLEKMKAMMEAAGMEIKPIQSQQESTSGEKLVEGKVLKEAPTQKIETPNVVAVDNTSPTHPAENNVQSPQTKPEPAIEGASNAMDENQGSFTRDKTEDKPKIPSLFKRKIQEARERRLDRVYKQAEHKKNMQKLIEMQENERRLIEQ